VIPGLRVAVVLVLSVAACHLAATGRPDLAAAHVVTLAALFVLYRQPRP
jgi:hypothetical protein